MFILFTILLPIMWIISIYILRKWDYFYLFFGLNLVMTVLFYYLITATNIFISGQNEHGLETLYNVVIYVVIHTIVMFAFSLFYKLKNLHNVNQ